MTMDVQGAIGGVRVLEGSGRLAVAVCGSLLAQLGAEVISLDHSADRGYSPLSWGKRRIVSSSADEEAKILA